MPWKECSVMSQRLEVVELARAGKVGIAALCRQRGISRKTLYKWIARYNESGAKGLADLSRRPHSSPRRSVAELEEAVLKVRQANPCWGGRKIARLMIDQKITPQCAPSTVTEILHRHQRIDPVESQKRQPVTRFEYPSPNDLWQMDFKGHFALRDGSRCHPLGVIDDHSRYALVLAACVNQQTLTVRTHLTIAFQTHGLPQRILCDNGSPWGTSGSAERHTKLTLWLLRHGVSVSHGRAYHPQTQGKEERFNRTVGEEVIDGKSFAHHAAAQAVFDPWRGVYNHQRPHEGIGLAVPASRYRPSPRRFSETLPPLVYPAGDLVRQVTGHASITLHGKRFTIGKAFRHEPIGLRPTPIDGIWSVYYAHQQVGQIDERGGSGPMCRAMDEWVNQPGLPTAEAAG